MPREDDDGELQRPALPLDDLPSGPPPDRPPESGFEYLQQVRWEAAQYPDVVVADIDPALLQPREPPPPAPQRDTGAPEHLLPSRDWEREFLSWFSELRQALNRLATRPIPDELRSRPFPRINDGNAWRSFCLGRKRKIGTEDRSSASGFSSAASEAGSSDARGEVSPTGPLLHVVLRLDQGAIQTLVERHVEWLEGCEGREDGRRPLTRGRALWLFALLARLDRLLHGDTAAALTALARLCMRLRAAMAAGEDAQLPAANMLITIVTKYFKVRVA
eukprot:tig00021537_g22272.t1